MFTGSSRAAERAERAEQRAPFSFLDGLRGRRDHRLQQFSEDPAALPLLQEPRAQDRVDAAQGALVWHQVAVLRWPALPSARDVQVRLRADRERVLHAGQPALRVQTVLRRKLHQLRALLPPVRKARSHIQLDTQAHSANGGNRHGDRRPDLCTHLRCGAVLLFPAPVSNQGQAPRCRREWRCERAGTGHVPGAGEEGR